MVTDGRSGIVMGVPSLTDMVNDEDNQPHWPGAAGEHGWSSWWSGRRGGLGGRSVADLVGCYRPDGVAVVGQLVVADELLPCRLESGSGVRNWTPRIVHVVLPAVIVKLPVVRINGSWASSQARVIGAT